MGLNHGLQLAGPVLMFEVQYTLVQLFLVSIDDKEEVDREGVANKAEEKIWCNSSAGILKCVGCSGTITTQTAIPATPNTVKARQKPASPRCETGRYKPGWGRNRNECRLPANVKGDRDKGSHQGQGRSAILPAACDLFEKPLSDGEQDRRWEQE